MVGQKASVKEKQVGFLTVTSKREIVFLQEKFPLFFDEIPCLSVNARKKRA